MLELIATKIVPPRRRPDLLDRPRLLHTLLDNAHQRLVLVSAPAGYGKTSLLVDFACRLDHIVCWYTVTESDRNLWTFARYIVGAIQQELPDFGKRSLQHIEAEGDNHDPLVAALVNELHALDQHLSLIIDDLHLIEDVPGIKEFLESLIPLLPENCHLVISSRAVPNFDLEMATRLVAHREVIGVGHEDLRFTPEEVQAFLHHAYGHAVSLDEARELVEASEGWITAIVLTSQADDPLAAITRARKAGRQVYDYLASEVLDRLSPHTRDFLMESAVLSEMEPMAINALLGITEAGAILEALQKPGELGAEEWKAIMRHPEIGEEIVAPVTKLVSVASIIRAHQEKYDGTGYPDGLRGAEIPLGARILAVADAYGAIIDERVYKPARSHEEAVAELRRCAGTQFDPQVVEAFLQVLERDTVLPRQPQTPSVSQLRQH